MEDSITLTRLLLFNLVSWIYPMELVAFQSMRWLRVRSSCEKDLCDGIEHRHHYLQVVLLQEIEKEYQRKPIAVLSPCEIALQKMCVLVDAIFMFYYCVLAVDVNPNGVPI